MSCDCSVVELRQYTLHPHARDILIDLFERRFRPGLEAAGMHVLGQFRDLDDPDRFVWLRGFPGMDARAAALTEFYLESTVWKTYRDQANATMIDSDDVLLLRPIDLSGLADRPGTPGLVTATVYAFEGPVERDFVELFESRIAPAATAAGARLRGWFETEPAENTFPRLPVREGEHVFVWLASFADVDAHRAYLGRLAATPEWTRDIRSELADRLIGPPRELRLEPTSTSQLH